MKLSYLVILLFFALSLNAQTEKATEIVFEGYILSEDSVPMADAHLINYRTMKIITTNNSGYFRTYLQTGDSLMINHLSLAPKVVHANTKPATENKFYVPYREFMISEVVSNKYLNEMKNLEKTTQTIQKQAQIPQLNDIDLFPLKTNTYEYEPVNYGLTLNINYLRKLFKKKKK